MEQKKDILSPNHWKYQNYTQRMTSKDWKTIVLNGDDKIIFRNNIVQLFAKNLGNEIYEVGKKETHQPKDEDEGFRFIGGIKEI